MLAGLVIGAALVGSACTSNASKPSRTSADSVTGSVTATAAVTATGVISGTGPASTPPGRSASRSARSSPTPTHSATPARVREKPGPCPYLSNQREADLEGTRVGRSTVLTSTPVGCRFYDAYDETQPTMELTIHRYATATAAFNRVARTGGSSAFGTPGIGAGAVLYRMSFDPADGDRDWACAFAKGTLVVVIKTGQAKSSADARNVARAVVDRI